MLLGSNSHKLKLDKNFWVKCDVVLLPLPLYWVSWKLKNYINHIKFAHSCNKIICSLRTGKRFTYTGKINLRMARYCRTRCQFSRACRVGIGCTSNLTCFMTSSAKVIVVGDIFTTIHILNRQCIFDFLWQWKLPSTLTNYYQRWHSDGSYDHYSFVGTFLKVWYL